MTIIHRSDAFGGFVNTNIPLRGTARKPPPNPRIGSHGRATVADIVVYARDDTDRHVDLWLTDQQPTITAGYGGWQTHQRPRRASLTVWEGREPFQLTIPALLYRAGNAVTDDIHDIEVMGSGTTNGAPPIVRAQGALMIPLHAGTDFVVQDVSWGDGLRRASDAVLIKQEVTLTLLEYVDDSTLRASTLADHRGRKTVVRHYHVKKGDSLQSIAARQLGDPKRWADIATLNGLRSSGHLQVGSTLRLP